MDQFMVEHVVEGFHPWELAHGGYDDGVRRRHVVRAILVQVQHLGAVHVAGNDGLGLRDGLVLDRCRQLAGNAFRVRQSKDVVVAQQRDCAPLVPVLGRLALGQQLEVDDQVRMASPLDPAAQILHLLERQVLAALGQQQGVDAPV